MYIIAYTAPNGIIVYYIGGKYTVSNLWFRNIDRATQFSTHTHATEVMEKLYLKYGFGRSSYKVMRYEYTPQNIY